MTDPNELSPEEKLLKVIQQGRRGPEAAARTQTPGSERAGARESAPSKSRPDSVGASLVEGRVSGTPQAAAPRVDPKASVSAVGTAKAEGQRSEVRGQRSEISGQRSPAFAKAKADGEEGKHSTSQLPTDHDREGRRAFNLPACQPRTAWGRLAPDRLQSGGQAGVQPARLPAPHSVGQAGSRPTTVGRAGGHSTLNEGVKAAGGVRAGAREPAPSKARTDSVGSSLAEGRVPGAPQAAAMRVDPKASVSAVGAVKVEGQRSEISGQRSAVSGQKKEEGRPPAPIITGPVSVAPAPMPSQAEATKSPVVETPSVSPSTVGITTPVNAPNTDPAGGRLPRLKSDLKPPVPVAKKPTLPEKIEVSAPATAAARTPIPVPAAAAAKAPVTEAMAQKKPMAGRPVAAVAPKAPVDKPQSKPAADAGESRLTLKAKQEVVPPVAQQLGSTPPQVKIGALSSIPRAKARSATRPMLVLMNRGLAACAVALAVGLALELLAARPAMPQFSGRNVSSPDLPGNIVSPPAEAACVEVMKRDIWNIGESAPTSNTTGTVPLPSSFDNAVKYVQQVMKLDGVSIYPKGQEGMSFAVITEQQSGGGLATTYWKVGKEFSVSGGAADEKVRLSEIHENEVIFQYQGRPITLSGRR